LASPLPRLVGIGVQVGDQTGDAHGFQFQIESIRPDRDPLDQRLDDALLLSWEQHLPEFLKRAEGLGDVVLGDVALTESRQIALDPVQAGIVARAARAPGR